MSSDSVEVQNTSDKAIDIVVRKKVVPQKVDKRLYKYASGRPMKFQNVDELRRMILDYFENQAPHWEDQVTYIDKKDSKGKPIIEDGILQQECVIKKVRTTQRPLTVTGLAVALGTSRDVLLDYENTYAEKYPEFSNAIKEAKEQIKEYAEESLFGSNATGPIFNLKNNWGFKDKYETENVNQEVRFINTVPRPADD